MKENNFSKSRQAKKQKERKAVAFVLAKIIDIIYIIQSSTQTLFCYKITHITLRKQQIPNNSQLLKRKRMNCDDEMN